MNIRAWLKNWVFQVLSIDTLRAEVRSLSAQVSALGGLNRELSDEITSLRGFIDTQYQAASQELTDVESRMMMRIAQIEEIRQESQKEEKPAEPAKGYVKWSDRMKALEQAATIPNKYSKKKTEEEVTNHVSNISR